MSCLTLTWVESYNLSIKENVILCCYTCMINIKLCDNISSIYISVDNDNIIIIDVYDFRVVISTLILNTANIKMCCN